MTQEHDLMNQEHELMIRIDEHNESIGDQRMLY